MNAGRSRPATAPVYEVIDPRFRSFVVANALLEPLVDGCRWLEGPVWFADHQVLLVSDIPNDRILRVTEAAEVSVFRAPAGYPNGHARDREGRLIGCSHQHRAITRTELDGRVTTLVDQHLGKRLNAPNDVVVARDGSVWFTDPIYGLQNDYEGDKQTPELPAAVYRFDPARNRLTLMTDEVEGPNGLCFSPDEGRLYVAESGDQYAPAPRRHILVFELPSEHDDQPLGAGCLFHTVSPGYADGMRCDTDGNLWSSAGDGVHCIDPSGALLGKIVLPVPVSNLCFGGRRSSRLLMCAGSALYALTVNRRGCASP